MDSDFLENAYKGLMTRLMEYNTQPAPVPNDKPAVWQLVKKDMLARNAFGLAKYGTPLQPFNGRDALKDAYEEALDLCVYLRTALYERDCK